MKKVYMCPNCNQYHPESNKHGSQHLSKSKQTLRFSDLFVNSRIEANNSKVYHDLLNKQIKIPDPHPENMTISNMSMKHHWDKNSNKSNKNRKSSIVKVKHMKGTVKKLKLFKQKQQKKSALDYMTPSRYKNTYQKSKSITSGFNPNQNASKLKKNMHLDSTNKASQLSKSLHKNTGFFSILHSSHDRTVNKMTMDYENQELPELNLKEKIMTFGMKQDSGLRNQRDKYPGLVYQSKILEDKLETVKLQSVYQMQESPKQKEQSMNMKINYAQQMKNLRNILKASQSKALTKKSHYLCSQEYFQKDAQSQKGNMIKIGDKYYFRQINEAQFSNNTIKDNRCCGFNSEDDTKFELTQVPPMFL